MTSITLELTDELAARLDAERGEQPRAEYATALLADVLADDDELTPAEHIRRANEVAANAIPVAEAEKQIWADFEQAVANYRAGRL